MICVMAVFSCGGLGSGLGVDYGGRRGVIDVTGGMGRWDGWFLWGDCC